MLAYTLLSLLQHLADVPWMVRQKVGVAAHKMHACEHDFDSCIEWDCMQIVGQKALRHIV